VHCAIITATTHSAVNYCKLYKQTVN